MGRAARYVGRGGVPGVLGVGFRDRDGDSGGWRILDWHVTMDLIVTVSGEPEPDAEQIIGDGLNAFNDAIVGYADRMKLHVIVKDPASGKVVGGISGRTSLGLLFIDLVYLPDTFRGQDVGTRMMTLAE